LSNSRFSGVFMKKTFSIVFVILTYSFTSFAQSFEHIPLKQLIEESDMVVSGTLNSVSRYSKDNIDYSQGEIVIEEVILGNVKTIEGASLKMGDKIQLTWQNPSTKVNGRIELGGSENNEVIWILKVTDDGTVTSNYFWCYWATSQLNKIKNTSKKVKKQRDLKIIKLIKENNADVNFQSRQESKSELPQSNLSQSDTQYSNHSYLAASIVIFTSFILYWIFYRSRFKIR
jgi:hypothetical protein